MERTAGPMRPGGRELAIDTGIVVLIVLAGLFTMEPRRGGEIAAIVAVASPLVVRRLWPFAVFVAVAAIALATSSASPSPAVQVVCVALAAFTTGECARDRVASLLGVTAVTACLTVGLIAEGVRPLEALVLPFAIVLPAWLVGDVVRARRDAAAARAVAAEQAFRDAEARLVAAAAEERRHMARELHDVVAHGVSVMLIQAGAARQVVETSPGPASDALLTVEATGREVMAELRRLLGVLNDDGEAAGLSPQPGIDEVGALVERVRAAGLPADLEIDGSPRALPSSLDIAAYRIVQEALTNALRYARRASTLVHIAYEPEQLRLEILDDGPADASGAEEGTGRGLVGMEQRAALVGGRLEAGPRLGGGYAVRAWLPIAPTVS